MNVIQEYSLEEDGMTQAQWELEGDECEITFFLPRIKKKSPEKIAEFINELFLTEYMCAKSHYENVCKCETGDKRSCIFWRVSKRIKGLLHSRFRSNLRSLLL